MALKAHDRALEHAYGPRRLTLMEQKAQTQIKAGNKPGAKATLEQALTELRSLPIPQKQQASRAAARVAKALESL